MHNHNLEHKGIKKIMNLEEKAFGLTRTRQNQSPQTTTIPYKLQGASPTANHVLELLRYNEDT